MNIIIDGTIYSSAPSGGAFRYFNELIPRLSRFPNTEVNIFNPLMKSKYTNSIIDENIPAIDSQQITADDF